MMKQRVKKRAIGVGVALASAGLVLGTVAPAQAAISHDYGTVDCVPYPPGRPAIYASATGTITRHMAWDGGSQTRDYPNGSEVITRTMVAPIGVARTGANTAYSTSNGTWQQLGKDCRAG